MKGQHRQSKGGWVEEERLSIHSNLVMQKHLSRMMQAASLAVMRWTSCGLPPKNTCRLHWKRKAGFSSKTVFSLEGSAEEYLNSLKLPQEFLEQDGRILLSFHILWVHTSIFHISAMSRAWSLSKRQKTLFPALIVKVHKHNCLL